MYLLKFLMVVFFTVSWKVYTACLLRLEILKCENLKRLTIAFMKPKLYRSVIEDVIEGAWDLFAEEGIEEQVLKDLKQVCRQYSFLFLLFLHLKKLKL